MKTTYSDIEIEYSERDDLWHFELRGRKRSAATLSKAKEAIEKEPPQKRKQEFPRFYSYKCDYRGISLVTVTSVAEEDYRGLRFWVSENGDRSKVSASDLFPVNEHNSAAISQIKTLRQQIEALEKQLLAVKKTLRPATIPAELKDA